MCENFEYNTLQILLILILIPDRFASALLAFVSCAS